MSSSMSSLLVPGQAPAPGPCGQDPAAACVWDDGPGQGPTCVWGDGPGQGWLDGPGQGPHGPGHGPWADGPGHCVWPDVDGQDPWAGQVPCCDVFGGGGRSSTRLRLTLLLCLPDVHSPALQKQAVCYNCRVTHSTLHQRLR